MLDKKSLGENFDKFNEKMKVISKMTPKKFERWIKSKIVDYYVSVGIPSKIAKKLSENLIDNIDSILSYIHMKYDKETSEGFFRSLIGILVLTEIKKEVLSPFELGTLSFINYYDVTETEKEKSKKEDLAYID